MDLIQLTDMFRRELDLCKVKKGEVMAVLTGPATNPHYARGFVAAGQQLGAEVFQLDVQPPTNFEAPTTAQGAFWGKTPISGHKSAVKTLKQADILIDLMLLLHSPEQEEIKEAGTRILMCCEPAEILARMFPRDGLRRRVEAGAERISRAKEARITNVAGTDLVAKLGQYGPILQYGYTDQRGRWDHFAGGFVYTWPNEGQTNGRVVLREGDIIFPFKDYLRGDIDITIKNGFITDIQGGYDARILRDFMESWDDPDAYAMAHLGWGLDEMALWTGATLINKESAIGMDGRAFYGGILWSTGPNTDVHGGRNTPAHLDIAMQGASFFLDGEPIVVDGDVVPSDLRVERRQMMGAVR